MPVVPRDVLNLLSNSAACFTSAHRLLQKQTFQHVLCAENISDKNFKIFFIRNYEENSRLGIIVAKKNVSFATNRNFLKRIIRESFRHHSVVKSKLDIVIMLRRKYSEKVDGLEVNLETLFSRVQKKCAEL